MIYEQMLSLLLYREGNTLYMGVFCTHSQRYTYDSLYLECDCDEVVYIFDEQANHDQRVKIVVCVILKHRREE